MLTHEMNAQSKPFEKKFIVGYGQTVKSDTVQFQWKGFVIEDIVNPDGTNGSPLVTFDFVITLGSDSAIWQITLPANYHEVISDEPNRVTYFFKGLKFQLQNAVIETHEDKNVLIGIYKHE